jgi:putative acetyltransferase
MSREVAIRPLRPGDAAERAAARAVLTEAFRRPIVADLAEALRDARPSNAALSFVAESNESNESDESTVSDGGRLVGVVQLSTSWLDAPSRLVEVLVLSPLGVAPDQHGRGIGTRLVEQAVLAATSAGAPLVFLEGDPGYYSRFGFGRAAALGFGSPSVRIPDAGFQVLVLPAHQPWMTGALVYADPFWAYDCVGLRSS